MSEAYKLAGVDVEAGYEAVNLMKKHVARTNIAGVLSGIGGFGGLFELGKGYENPVLVSGTDGVGTKLKIAFLMDKHDTVGQDCVAMCVNDIACSGAKPLFFLDYIALGKNIPEKVADIVGGIADGCVAAGCALVGGETAEMPGFYPVEEYDLAGFSVGVVEKDKILDGSQVKAGDALIGVASSGVHSNGYSLVRKVFNLSTGGSARIMQHSEFLGGVIGEELLKPTKIYVKPLLKAIEDAAVHGVSHITGGGFIENIPRMLNDGVRAKIEKNSFEILPIFQMIAEMGRVEEMDMFNTFNMGIGLVLAVDKEDADKTVRLFESMGEQAYIIGEVVAGERGIDIC